MNATALFLEPSGSLEATELQPLPDASEAAWDRWIVKTTGSIPITCHGEVTKVSRFLFDQIIHNQW